MKMLYRCLFIVIALRTADAAAVCGQNSAPVIPTPQIVHQRSAVPQPVPLSHLYWHFFVLQKHLDNEGTKLDSQGKDGRPVRNHLQQQLGFDDADFVAVRVAGERVIAEVQTMRQKAQKIVAADHQARKAGVFTTPDAAPGLPELKQLNQDREDLMQKQIEKMNDSLGSAKAKTLKDYLQQHLAANVTTIKLDPKQAMPAFGPRPANQKQVQP